MGENPQASFKLKLQPAVTFGMWGTLGVGSSAADRGHSVCFCCSLEGFRAWPPEVLCEETEHRAEPGLGSPWAALPGRGGGCRCHLQDCVLCALGLWWGSKARGAEGSRAGLPGGHQDLKA